MRIRVEQTFSYKKLKHAVRNYIKYFELKNIALENVAIST